jgi:putative phage-type endonuclease
VSGIRVNVRQNTPEWLAWRATGIGASDVPAIVGESPYRSPWDVWAEKSGRVIEEPDAETLERFAIGHLMEPALLRIHDLLTGRKARAGACYRHPEIPWAITSLDGTAPVRRVVEAKWTNSEHWRGEGAPGFVRFQVQWQMFVTGWAVADVVALVNGRPRVVEERRDDDLIDALYTQAADLWQRVQDGREPEPDGSEATRKAIARLHPEDNGIVLPSSPEFAEIVEQLRTAKATAKAAEDAEKTLSNALRAMVGDASGVDGLFTYRQNAPSTRVNWPAVAGAFRELLAGHHADELDAIQSIHSETTPGPRVLRLSKGDKAA